MNNAQLSEFLTAVSQSFDDQTLVKLSLGKYRGEGTLKKVLIAPLMVKGEKRLGFRFQHQRQEISKNFNKRDGDREIEALFSQGFQSGNLFTTQFDLELEFGPAGSARLKKKAATFTEPPLLEHNREKIRRVEASRPYLYALGISDAVGRVKPESQAKYRQIDKFIETLDGLMRESGLADAQEISFRDFGSGKSYLTFALFDHLTKQGKKVHGQGIEQRAELVEASKKLANQTGFNGLEFIAGNIKGLKAAPVDIAIALHACDTATDDAILHAVQSDARLLVLAPCCQRYVRKRLKIPATLRPILKHGIHEEWFAATLTDSLRALWLESCGYSSRVFEFISQEYTHKNNMLVAVKGKARPAAHEELQRLKAEHGLTDFYLDVKAQ